MTRARDLADSADKDIAGTVTLDDITLSNDITLADNGKAIFGAGSDLQIYHDGNSKITDVGDGKLELHSNGTGVTIQKGATEYMAQFLTDGAVQLYYDNAVKLATTSTGVDITGTLTSDLLTVNNSTVGDLITVTGANGTDLRIGNHASANGGIYINSQAASDDLRFRTQGSDRMTIDSSGNVGIDFTPKTMTANVTSSLNVGSGTVFQRTKDTFFASNMYYNASDAGTSISTGYGLVYYQDVTNGAHKWFTSAASAGSADATHSFSIPMTIASTGELLVGTTSDTMPAAAAAGQAIMAGTRAFIATETGGDTILGGTTGSNFTAIYQGGSERMRIDSSGNLLVGTESADNADAGFEARSDGRIFSTATSNSSFNRLSSDGDIVTFQKDTTTTVGSISSVLNGSDRNLDIGSGDTRLLFYGPTNPAYVPRKASNAASDGYADLGLSSNRFKDLYLAGDIAHKDAAGNARLLYDKSANLLGNAGTYLYGFGVYLGGTGSANLLEDYEEGTFDSHIYDDHDDSLKISFTAQGDYVKIGNILTFNAQCFGNGVASTTFTGKPYMRLPFTITQANATIAYLGYYNGIGTAKQGYVLGASSNEIRFATQLDNPYNNQLADGDTWGGNIRLYISGTVAVAV